MYCDLVKNVREAFEVCELVRIDCQGIKGSDFRKIGAKLKVFDLSLFTHICFFYVKILCLLLNLLDVLLLLLAGSCSMRAHIF